MGVPLSQIASTRTVEAVRPDGSRVWVRASNVIAGLEPDTEPQPEPDDIGLAENEFIPAVDYQHAGSVTVPTGEKGRVRANLAALELIARLDDAHRHATPPEQQILAAWSGWGGCATVFDESRSEWERERELLQQSLSADEYRAARHSTLNAHYTDPAVVAVMWDVLVEAGFDGGRVLEPGCGSGNFIGLAPESATMVGVELDLVSAKIANYLYPVKAQIRNEGFERTRIGDGSFVAAIGNVPFGGFSLVDPVHNAAGHNIHNHFILKSLNLVAPGGYAALITSSFTLDASDPKARTAIHEVGELVAAVRLPSRAFQRVAATQVVTDVLVFRRRAEDEALPHPSTVDWLHTDDVVVPTREARATVRMNRWFVNHPEMVLGSVRADRGLYRDGSLVVHNDDLDNIGTQLRQALTPLIAQARDRGAGLTARHRVRPQLDHAGLATTADLYAEDQPAGRIAYDEATDTFHRRTIDGETEPFTVYRTRATETRHLLRLRDLTEAAVASQRSHADLTERDAIRLELNKVYDAYVATYGPLNRSKLSGGNQRTSEEAAKKLAELDTKYRNDNRDLDTGEPFTGTIPADILDELEEKAWTASPLVRRQTHLEALKTDPSKQTILALERWDDETGRASKSAIFSRDVVARPTPILSATSPAEAVAISLGETGAVDVDRIADLLSVTTDQARTQIRGLVFPDPEDPAHPLIPAAVALSGHVIAKAERTAVLAESEPDVAEWRDLYTALLAAAPTPKSPSQIGEVSPGVTWIATGDYEQFVRDTFRVADVRVEHTSASGWIVSATGADRWNAKVKSEFGFSLRNKGRDAIELYEALLNQQPIVLRNSKAAQKDGASEVDEEATAIAQVQAKKITAEFQAWVWSDPARRERLLTEWNRRFNAWVAPRHDGMYLQLPGLSPAFTPHWYQRNAVARIAAEPTVLLDHVVGAGKTGTLFMSAMELKRRGLVNQPWIVVPTHLIEQFGREVKQWYPAANVLVGSKGMDDEDRRLFVAQTATSDWDMVIVPQSVFERINVAPQRQIQYIQTELDGIEAELLRASSTGNAPSNRTVKEVEKYKARLDKRLKTLIDRDKKDAGAVLFEQTGCDYLFVDEAHGYKNKSRLCAIESLAHTGSQKAEDLSLKLSVLRERVQERAAAQGQMIEPGRERVATFATGTPIANSLAEAWVMQQYLRPDVLEVAGVRTINDWAAAFTATKSETVTNTAGTKLKVITKVAAFSNPREMFAMSAQYTDVVVRAQVPAKLPIHDGRQIITIPASQTLRDFSADLEYRLDNADPRRPDIDNVLKVLSDGRNAALDPRLANLEAPDDEYSRAHAVARNAADIYHQAAANTYVGEDGSISPTPGALQLIFCDRGTPKSGGAWSFYDGMRDHMIELGVPEEKIAYIHDAKTAQQKQTLSASCVSGQIAVLIGSTEKMGTGMNVQARLIALHHVDVPWRPADLEQREGRIIRQGNQNERIGIFTYVTEATTDTVMWAKVESKAQFIEQAKSGQLDETVTSVEDVSEESLSAAAAATKAAATGDPRFIALVENEERLKELRALAGAHCEAKWTATHNVREAARAIPKLEEEIAFVQARLDTHAEWTDANKPFTVDGRGYRERTDRSAALLDQARAAYLALKGQGLGRSEVIATFPGAVDVRLSRGGDDRAWIYLDMPAELGVLLDRTALWPAGQQENLSSLRSGFATRVENLYDRLPGRIARAQALIDDKQRTIAIYTPKMAEQFSQVGELDALEVSVQRLRRDIEAQQNTPEAIARRAEAGERMRAAGRRPGWTLELNPSKAMVAESDFDTADEYVDAVSRMHMRKAASYARSTKPLAADGRASGCTSDELAASLLDDLAATVQGLPDVRNMYSSTQRTSAKRLDNSHQTPSVDRGLGI